MIAVRADDGLGEVGRLITIGPMEGWFENNLLCGVALRLIEAPGRFKLSEDVRYAVVADAIPCPEVRVCVVIKRTPSDAARELRVRCELVVDASVPPRVFALAV